MLDFALVAARLRAAGCVFAEDEARLLMSAARSADELADMTDRRATGQPLELVIGWAEFCGLRIGIDPGVFIPRRRTEFLVSEAVRLARAAHARRSGSGAWRGTVVVDLCCGSGAVGAAIAAALPGVELHATDIDPAAVRCARRNVAEYGRVYQGDLYQPLPERLRGRVDLLVANVPYVPTAEVGLMPPEARLYEPRASLDGGADGLDVLRRVTATAPEWLSPDGYLLIETSERQAAVVAETFGQAGLAPRVASSEELYATVIIGAARRG